MSKNFGLKGGELDDKPRLGGYMDAQLAEAARLKALKENKNG